MQTEKFQPEGKRKMSETRFTEFPALSVDPRLGFLGMHRRPLFDYLHIYDISNYLSLVISFMLTFYVAYRPTFSERHSVFFVVAHVT